MDLPARLGGVLDCLYPGRCVACGRSGHPSLLCPDCIAAFPAIPVNACQRCRDLRADRGLCQRCRTRAPAFCSVQALGLYAGTLRSALRALKYQGRDHVAGVLADLIVTRTTLSDLERPIIATIPAQRRRRRRRGGDHLLRLAHCIAQDLPGSEHAPDALLRRRETAAQVGLGPAARQRNVAAAFQARPSLVEGRHCILIDDVVTTGATVREASSCLRSAGASGIHVLAIARASLGLEAGPASFQGL